MTRTPAEIDMDLSVAFKGVSDLLAERAHAGDVPPPVPDPVPTPDPVPVPDPDPTHQPRGSPGR